jgi:hypothetical protein
MQNLIVSNYPKTAFYKRFMGYGILSKYSKLIFSVTFCHSMQKVTKKIFGWLNALRQKAALERHPAKVEFIVLSCGAVSNGTMHLIPPASRSFTCASHFSTARRRLQQAFPFWLPAVRVKAQPERVSAVIAFLVTFFAKKVTRKINPDPYSVHISASSFP